MLSKSKFQSFLKCPKCLWLHKYKKEYADFGNMQDIMDQGNVIGDLAMGLFGDFTEVTVLKEDGTPDISKMIERTNELLASGESVICEASFSYNGCYCAVDILRKENGGYTIYEVKSSTAVKDTYITDLAYQKYVLTNCGIKVTDTYLVCINSDYVFDGTLDLMKLFKINHLTDEVNCYYPYVEDDTLHAKNVLATKDEIDTIYNANCKGCEFYGYCTKDLPHPNVFDLYGIGFSFKKMVELYNEGKVSFSDLLGDKRIKGIRAMQINHELNDLGDEVNKKEVKRFLDTLTYPMYFLDFETMQLAVPEFIGTKPFAQIPFQYSLHYIENEGGELKHKEFLAESGTDPRRAIAESLCRDIPRDVCVIAYNKSFECGRIRELADTFCDLSDHLLNIENNIVDLIEPFRGGHYYNKNMGGSFSIKSVLPALFPSDPTLDYHNLEGVHNGGEAMTIFPKIKDMSPSEREKARRSLLEYCKLDTYAMVKVYEKLKEVI